jgi:capsule polysaccharide export protein KpsE/RkpR
MGVGLVLSIAVAFVIPNRFKSTARLMPPDQMDSSAAMLAAAASTKAGPGFGAVATNLLGLKSTGELFVGMLESRTIQDDIINRFDLRKLYRERLLEDARDDLAKNTSISEDRKSGIITIQVTDKSPQRAAAMAQQYVEELNRVVTQLNTSSAHRERVFLEERLAQVEQGLESAEKGFSEFASKNTAIDIQAQSKAMIDAAATLEGELIATQTELQGLKQIYADGNVRVRTTEARLEELRRQLQKIGGKSDITALPDSQSDASVIQPSIRQLPLLGVNYADLDRSAKVQEVVFETLTQEYELAKVEEAKQTPSVKVIDPPDVPGKKSYPHRLWIILLSTLGTGILGTIWVLGGAHWEEIDPQDPGKVLALEVFQAVKTGLPAAAISGFTGAARKHIRNCVRAPGKSTLNNPELRKAEE